ncbi:response regulator [Phormidesmis sp. 146-12]
MDSEFEVVGVAATGRIAIAKIPQVNPDVVILDIEMPDMNGLETLAEIRRSYPNLPVIMFSTQTHTGAAATLDALALGASDYATKPSQLGSVEAANQHIQETLFPKIKFFGAKPADRLRVFRLPLLQFNPPIGYALALLRSTFLRSELPQVDRML